MPSDITSEMFLLIQQFFFKSQTLKFKLLQCSLNEHGVISVELQHELENSLALCWIQVCNVDASSHLV